MCDCWCDGMCPNPFLTLAELSAYSTFEFVSHSNFKHLNSHRTATWRVKCLIQSNWWCTQRRRETIIIVIEMISFVLWYQRRNLIKFIRCMESWMNRWLILSSHCPRRLLFEFWSRNEFKFSEDDNSVANYFRIHFQPNAVKWNRKWRIRAYSDEEEQRKSNRQLDPYCLQSFVIYK